MPSRGPGVGPPSPVVSPVASVVIWGIVAGLTCSGGALFVFLLSRAQTDITIAALGAMFSTVFIGMYVFARGFEKIVAALERLRSLRHGSRR